MKINDVYKFRYNEAETKNRFEPYHCFDGQFIVKQNKEGELYLMDTYWASKYDGFKHWGDYKWKSVKDAMNEGKLSFVCNLDEVEEIAKDELQYYSDEDVFDLSYQHHCYSYYVKRKGAVRSQDKMLQSVRQKIDDAKYKKSAAERDIADYTLTLQKIEAGDTSIYI